MPQDLKRTVKNLWNQLSWAQRLSIAGLTAGIVIAASLLMMWANAPTYGVLFTGLDSTDASSITAQLDAAKIPYQLSNGGTTISVPTAMVDRERLQMAGQGLPAGGVVGFSLFDKSSIFQGDSFTEQINYTRALEGELTKTIGQVSGVLYDRVNIVIPQQNLFSNQQVDPTASVLLKIGPGNGLNSDQIGGIQHLVASAVQGLKPDAVTVVDGSGTILSGNSSSDPSAMGMTALQAQARYASNLEAQLTAMLDTVVGADRAVVRVHDIMNWTQREVTSNTYAPQTGKSPVNTSHVAQSTSLGPNGSTGGVAGLGSNVPTYGTNTSGTGTYTQTQRVADTTYATSSSVSHVVEPPGTLQSVSVSVLLDGITNQSVITSLRQAVIAAAGLNTARGDQISISSVAFDTSAQATALKATADAQQREFILSIVRWAALIIVPLVLLFLLRRMLVASRVRPYNPSAFPGVEVMESQEMLGASSDTMVSLPPAKSDRMRQDLAALARSKPEVVAGLIGRWIDEDRG